MKFTKRQTEIINAATSLINEGGIQHLTTKLLAQKMGFSEPAIYRHFKDKNEILTSVLNYYKFGLKQSIDKIISEKINGKEKLGKIIQIQFQQFNENPAIVMVIFAESSFQNDIRLSDTVKNILIEKRERIEKIIKSGQRDGSVRKDISAVQLASIFMGSMRFTILHWRLQNYNFNLIKEGEKLWQALSKLLICKQTNI